MRNRGRKIRRSVTQEEIDSYRENGFVHLRNVLDETWLKVLAAAIHRVENEVDSQPRVMNMSALRRRLDAKKGLDEELAEATSDYIIAHNAWQWNDALRNVAFDSPMAELAAQLMNAQAIRFYFDQVFIKPRDRISGVRHSRRTSLWTASQFAVRKVMTFQTLKLMKLAMA